DQGSAGTLRGERRDSRLAGTLDGDRAYTFSGVCGEDCFAGTLDQGRGCTFTRIRREDCLAGTFDQGRGCTFSGVCGEDCLAGTPDAHRAGPGAGHRRKGRFARPDDRRFVAPVEPWRVVAGDDGGASAGDLMGVAHQVVDRVGDGLLVERPQRVRFGVEPGVQRLVQTSILDGGVVGEWYTVRPHRLHGDQATEMELAGAVGAAYLPVGARRRPVGEVARRGV